MVKHRIGRALVSLGLGMSCPWAVASDNQAEAQESYRRGAEAYNERRYDEAAENFARADAVSPHPVTLQIALQAAIRARKAGTVMQLVERVRSRNAPQKLRDLADQASAEFAALAGRVSVSCRVEEKCRANLEGLEVPAARPLWVEPGEHRLTIVVDGQRQERVLAVEAGRDVHVEPVRLGEPLLPVKTSVRRPEKPEPRVLPTMGAGPSSWWFWGGVTATALVAGAAAYSGVDTLSKHDSYQSTPTDSLRSDGQSAQLRTNVLLGATSVFALATVVTGLWIVDWQGARISAGSGGAALEWQQSF